MSKADFFHLKNHRGFFPKSFDQIIFQISFPKNQTKHDIVELRVRSFDPRITTPCYGSSISSSTRPGTGPSSIRPSATATGAMRPVNHHAGGGHQAHGLAERLGRDLRDLHRPGGWVVWFGWKTQ